MPVCPLVARRADGFWHQVNDKDEAIPGTAWAGDVRIDENGVLIRRGYATEPDPGSPNRVRIKTELNSNGRHVPVPKDTLYDLTYGGLEQHFPDGSAIRRDSDGRIISIQYPGGGERVRIDLDGSNIQGLTEGLERWLYSKGTNGFVADRSSNAALVKHSWTAVGVKHSAGDLTLIGYNTRSAYLKREVQRSVNGTIQLTESLASTPSDNSRSIGRRIRSQGTSDRISHCGWSGVPAVVWGRRHARAGRCAGSNGRRRPLLSAAAGPAVARKNVIRATALEFRGWGDDKLLSYLDEVGHRINVWPDGTSEEFDHDQGKVIRSKSPGAVTAVREGHLRSGERSGKGSGLWLVSDISPWRGTGLDKNSTLTVGADKVEQFSDSSQRFYYSSGRLSYSVYRQGRTIKYDYASATDTNPNFVDHVPDQSASPPITMLPAPWWP